MWRAILWHAASKFISYWHTDITPHSSHNKHPNINSAESFAAIRVLPCKRNSPRHMTTCPITCYTIPYLIVARVKGCLTTQSPGMWIFFSLSLCPCCWAQHLMLHMSNGDCSPTHPESHTFSSLNLSFLLYHSLSCFCAVNRDGEGRSVQCYMCGSQRRSPLHLSVSLDDRPTINLKTPSLHEQEREWKERLIRGEKKQERRQENTRKAQKLKEGTQTSTITQQHNKHSSSPHAKNALFPPHHIQARKK